jgi:hypothetical protein
LFSSNDGLGRSLSSALVALKTRPVSVPVESNHVAVLGANSCNHLTVVLVAKVRRRASTIDNTGLFWDKVIPNVLGARNKLLAVALPQ